MGTKKAKLSGGGSAARPRSLDGSTDASSAKTIQHRHLIFYQNAIYANSQLSEILIYLARPLASNHCTMDMTACGTDTGIRSGPKKDAELMEKYRVTGEKGLPYA